MESVEARQEREGDIAIQGVLSSRLPFWITRAPSYHGPPGDGGKLYRRGSPQRGKGAGLFMLPLSSFIG